MLSVTGLNHFYYVRDFTDMRCKHSRVLSIIRERLHREPRDGDVFIVMSRNRRIVRMFSFDNRSYSLFEKKFVAGYQFMKVERNGADTVYRIDFTPNAPGDSVSRCVFVKSPAFAGDNALAHSGTLYYNVRAFAINEKECGYV